MAQSNHEWEQQHMSEPGKWRHLISLAAITRSEIETLFASADVLRRASPPPLLRDTTVANLFFEPSTRTRVSFELAAMRLDAHVVELEAALEGVAGDPQHAPRGLGREVGDAPGGPFARAAAGLRH